MAKVILLVFFFTLAPLGFSQKATKRAANRTLEGVTISKNTATLKPGYEFVQEAGGVLSVRKKKKKKDLSGTIKCGCVGQGSCTLTTSGDRQAFCGGGCDDCTMLVEIPKKIQ